MSLKLHHWGYAKLCFFWDKLELHQCIAQWENFLTLNKQINMPFKMSKKHTVCSGVSFQANLFLYINSVFFKFIDCDICFYLHSKLCSHYLIILTIKGTLESRIKVWSFFQGLHLLFFAKYSRGYVYSSWAHEDISKLTDLW